MVKYFSVNGEIVREENANIRITDLGLLRGYGIFDFLKVHKGIPLFIEDHLNRFRNSAKYMHLELHYSNEELQRMVLALIAKNGFMEGGMKIVLTGGYSENGYLPSRETNLMILLTPLQPPEKAFYKKGVKLMLYEYVRELAEVKTTNYIVPIRLANDLKSVGAIDVLYHSNGKISESSRSNFFIVKNDNTILTPDTHILKGITRKRTIEMARQKYKVVEGTMTLEDLRNAKEAFLSSTTKGVLPVVQVDEIVIGSGQPGLISEKLNQMLTAQMEDYIYAFSGI